MKIVICDDAYSFLQRMQEMLLPYIGEADQLLLFDTGEQLLEYAQYSNIDILFMDIELGEISGIDVVRDVTQIRPKCQVVYMTNHVEYVSDVYETKHCYYVMKEQIESRLDSIMQIVNQKLYYINQKLIITDGGTNILIPLDEITYIERLKRVTYVYTVGATYKTRERIDAIEKRIPKNCFVRCHNSYIVSFEHIRIYSRSKIIMENGVGITISRRYIDSVKESFLSWGNLSNHI